MESKTLETKKEKEKEKFNLEVDEWVKRSEKIEKKQKAIALVRAKGKMIGSITGAVIAIAMVVKK